MPPILRNGSFLFILQSQPFYQAELVPVTTISTLVSSLAQVEEAEVSHFTKHDLYIWRPFPFWEAQLHLMEKLYVCLALFIREVWHGG